MSAIFIMPRSSSSWSTSEALWITVEGWSSASRKILGDGRLFASDKEIKSWFDEHYHPLNSSAAGKVNSIRRVLSNLVGTPYKDWQLYNYKKSKSYFSYLDQCLNRLEDVLFVWEQYDLFGGPGRKIADRLEIPHVLYVHAPTVWEARKWGVKRSFYGDWLERAYEAPYLKSADVVFCVSDQVANKLINMGVDPKKILVSPMAVNEDLFNVSGDRVIDEYGLKGKTVIGWTGSFRSFHGLDNVVDAFKVVNDRDPDTVLLLVGDGPLKTSIEDKVDLLGLTDSVRFAGRQNHADIPQFVNAFDIGLVSADRAENFHYSPLKLREYMAASIPCIAPRAGELLNQFVEGDHILLYDPGNALELASKVLLIKDDIGLSNKLSKNAKSLVSKKFTWEAQLNILIEHLNDKSGTFE